MKKLLLALLLAPLLAVAQVPQNIQKLSGNLTQSFAVPSGISISASGTGTIAATSVTGYSPASGKVLTLSNSMTFTATDGSTIAFGAGGTVLYSGGSYVSSIAGTSNRITVSASTGAVTLDLAGPHAFSSLTSTAVLLGGGTSAINASNLTYVSPTLTVPDSFTVASAGSIALTAGGSNKDIVMTTTGSGALSAVLTSTGLVKFNFNSVTPAAGTVTTGLWWINADGTQNNWACDAYGTNFGWTVRRANGTAVSPTAIASGDTLSAWNSGGYDTTNAFGIISGVLRFKAEEAFTSTAHGTSFAVELINYSSGPGARNTVFKVLPNGKIALTPVSATVAAWGTTGAALSQGSATYTDSSSSGTVASAVANSLAVPTFAASSSTTFTDAANLYIAGGPSAGTNVTIGTSWGLWNLGKTRLQDFLDVDMGSTLPAATSGATFRFRSFGLIDGLATSPFMTFRRTNGTAASPTVTVSGNNIGRLSGTGWDGSAYGQSADIIFNATETWSTSARGAEIQFRVQVNGGSGGTAGALTIANNAKLVHTPISSSVSAWTTTGVFESHAAATATDSSTAGSGTAASAVFYSFAAPTLAATNSSVTTTDAATVYIGGPVAAGTNQTITRSHSLAIVDSTSAASSVTGGLVISATLGTTATSVGIGGGNINAGGTVTSGGTLTAATGRVTLSTTSTYGVINFARSSSSAMTHFIQGTGNVTTDALTIYSSGGAHPFGTEYTSGDLSFYIDYTTTPIKVLAASGTALATGTTTSYWTTEATTGGAGGFVSNGGIYAAKKIITASTLTVLGGATFLTTSSALTDGAGALTATFTNSPVTGNPTKWIGINDNGTTRYIPAF